jgi:HAD superfamily hydrolase (TIGR01509 family)
VVLGKPAPEFFRTATAELDVAPARTLMIGDDLEADVLGAQHAGLTGVLVRTGKYRAGVEDTHEESPDHVLDGFADLPALLGL